MPRGSPISAIESLFVGAPHRPGGARVADRARLVHGAGWQRMVDPAEQAGDLDERAVRSGHDGHVAHATAPDPTPSRDRRPHAGVDRFHGHLRLPTGRRSPTGDSPPRVAYGPRNRYLNGALVPPAPSDLGIAVLTGGTLDSARAARPLPGLRRVTGKGSSPVRTA